MPLNRSQCLPKSDHVYDGTTPVLELNSTGGFGALNTWGPLGLVCRSTAYTSGTRWYAWDERGNASAVAADWGGLTSARTWDAFGLDTLDAAYASLSSRASEDANNPYDGFGGQFGDYTDRETNLVLCTFRYFDPTLGRWLTRDPIGYAGGLDLYGYVGNNPTNSYDNQGSENAKARQDKPAVLSKKWS